MFLVRFCYALIVAALSIGTTAQAADVQATYGANQKALETVDNLILLSHDVAQGQPLNVKYAPAAGTACQGSWAVNTAKNLVSFEIPCTGSETKATVFALAGIPGVLGFSKPKGTTASCGSAQTLTATLFSQLDQTVGVHLAGDQSAGLTFCENPSNLASLSGSDSALKLLVKTAASASFLPDGIPLTLNATSLQPKELNIPLRIGEFKLTLANLSLDNKGLHAVALPSLLEGLPLAFRAGKGVPILADFRGNALTFGCDGQPAADAANNLEITSKLPIATLTLGAKRVCNSATLGTVTLAITPSAAASPAPAALAIAADILPSGAVRFANCPDSNPSASARTGQVKCTFDLSALQGVALGNNEVGLKTSFKQIDFMPDKAPVLHFSLDATLGDVLASPLSANFAVSVAQNAAGGNTLSGACEPDGSAPAAASSKLPAIQFAVAFICDTDKTPKLALTNFKITKFEASSKANEQPKAEEELNLPNSLIDLQTGHFQFDPAKAAEASGSISIGPIVKASFHLSEAQFTHTDGLDIIGDATLAIPKLFSGTKAIEVSKAKIKILPALQLVCVGAIKWPDEIAVGKGRLLPHDKSTPLFTLQTEADGSKSISISADYYPPAFLGYRTEQSAFDIGNVNLVDTTIGINDLKTVSDEQPNTAPLATVTGTIIKNGAFKDLGITCGNDKNVCGVARIPFVKFTLTSFNFRISETSEHPQIDMVANKVSFDNDLVSGDNEGELRASYNDTGFVGSLTMSKDVTFALAGQSVAINRAVLQLTPLKRRLSARASITIKQANNLPIFFKEVSISQERPDTTKNRWSIHFNAQPDYMKTAFSAIGTILAFIGGAHILK